jgi:hypothetical protein
VAPPLGRFSPLGDDGLVATDSEQIAEVEAMFAAKGFFLSVERRDSSTVVPRPGRPSDDSFWVDLLSVRTGKVVFPNFGAGPSELLAIMVAEQRWLVEQEGSGSMPGGTYVEKAEERLRRNGDA